MHVIASRVNDRRSNEDHEVALAGSGRFAAEETADEWQVTQNRQFVFDLGQVFADEAAEHHGLTVPNDGAGDDLAQAETRERQGRCDSTAASDLSLRNESAGIIIAEE